MATLYKADGTVTKVKPAGKKFTLEEMQALVGGYIRGVRTDAGREMYVNEDGFMLRLPHNSQATRQVKKTLGPGDYIVGDAVVVNPGEF